MQMGFEITEDAFQITTGEFPMVQYIDKGSVSPLNTFLPIPIYTVSVSTCYPSQDKLKGKTSAVTERASRAK